MRREFPRLWRLMVAAAVASLGQQGRADPILRNLDDPDAPRWEEEAVVLPGFPDENNLREFQVSAVTANRFFIDAASLGVGKDGVVRYTLVVHTAGGATNTSFEGIRCDTRELKIYATGRSDATWSPARGAKWRPIENKQVNRQHAALAREFFCPGGAHIRTAAEGLEALRLGKHPDAP